MLVELRAHKHYTMCLGQHDNGQKIIWSESTTPTEITYDVLYKQLALLAVACVIAKKYAKEGLRNEYLKLIIASLWYHKISKEDCLSIITTVCNYKNDDVAERLAMVEDIYKRNLTEQLQGLPTLQKEFNWTEDEIRDFKKLLFRVTGRHILPEFTNDFVNRIAYMMKQKKYYDLEDK